MKISKRIVSVVLVCLLLSQSGWAAAAVQQQSTVEPHRMIYNDRTAEGNLLPSYMVDADGNRVDPPQSDTVYAEADSFPSKYDLRDEGVVTSVKNQAGAWNCWAFAAVSCMETSYIRQGLGAASSTDFAEAHLIWFGHRGKVTNHNDPTWGDGVWYSNPFMNGGSWEEAASTIMRGCGMQLESNAVWIDSYEPAVLMRMEQQESKRYESHARLWQATQIPEAQLTQSAIKSRIMQYGGIEVYYFDDYNHGQTAFNSTYNSYYQTKKSGESNHAVTLIGWDDSFPRTKFNTTAPSNGAWLVKGSWSKDYGAGGFFWLSYCDKSLMKGASFVAAPEDIYDNIYQYDGAFPTMGFPLTDTAKEANLFTAEKAETLTHVGVFSNNQQTMYVTARVYVDEGGFVLKNNNPTNGMRLVSEATTTIRDMEYGYRTIPLNRMVPLKQGQKFTVEITFTEPNRGQFYLPVEGSNPSSNTEGVLHYGGDEGESFMYLLGRWEDTNKTKIADGVTYSDFNSVPVKAMTTVALQEPTLDVYSLPNQTTYYVGDTLSTTGLALTYTDSRGVSSTVRSGFTCSPMTLTQEGAQQITVTYQGLQTSFTVQVQPVEFNLAESQIQLNYWQRQQLHVQKKPDSMQVSWSSADTKVATVSNTGLVHAVGEGDTVVTCSATYNGKQYQKRCAVHVDDPEVIAIRTTIAQTIYEGDTLVIPMVDVYYAQGGMDTFTDGFDYYPKTFGANDDDQTKSERTISFTFGKWSDTMEVDVEPLLISLNRRHVNMNTGYTTPVKATASPERLGVTWESSDPSVVTVSATGELRAKAPGSAVVTATVTNGAVSRSATCEVTVERRRIIRIVANIAQTLYEGDSLVIPMVDVYFSETEMVTVTEGFDYSPKTLYASGKQTLTLTFDGQSDTMELDVQPLTVALNQQSLDLRAGQTAQLSATAQPSRLPVTWTTSNASVAAVSNTGLVTAKASGTAVITATITNGAVSRSATCTVRVTLIPTLKIKTPSRTTLRYGESLTLHAETTNLPAGARILWTEGSNLTNQPGQNSDNYTVKAEKSGTVTVTAYLVDSAGNVIRNASGDPVSAKQSMTMNCGLLQKIGAFLRKLFGIKTHYPDIYE